NRTANYFKENEQFDQESFSEVVFRNEDISQKFRSFTQERSDVQVSLDEPFDIDQNAVKRKSRIFKSILKLDKNFHVYIHGNREMIEKGVDETGRKFYKLYYEEEQ
ncbi:MAG: nucleoid-associated protein, partial [Bacteroidota bacterium]|nr:nucleoid-associated protein [Bacteroidota bacterium]